MHFSKITRNAGCVFARTASVIEIDCWDSELNEDENVFTVYQNLKDSFSTSLENIDGVVIRINQRYISINALAVSFASILQKLKVLEGESNGLRDQNIDFPEWEFEIFETVCHILVFSPLYSLSHPRNTCGDDSTYILLQPHSSFVKKRDETGNIPLKIKEQIRQNYRKANQLYDIELSKSNYSARKFIKPLMHNDGIIKWWKHL